MIFLQNYLKKKFYLSTSKSIIHKFYFSSNLKENMLIYIDADNISHKNCQNIVNTITNNGKIVDSKIYGDWSQNNIRPWIKKALKFNIQLVNVERKKGKNSSDMRMCVDIMEDLFQKNNIEIFCIVSSDRDFSHVVEKIKSKNKKILIIENDLKI